MKRTVPLNRSISQFDSGCIKRALFLLYGANGLDYSAHGHLLQHCSSRHLVRQGKQIHARIVLFSVTPDNFLASKLLTFYSKAGHIFEARKVFDEIPHRNIFSWNAMLIAYSIQTKYAEILELFSHLNSSWASAPQPDHFTVTSVLKASSFVLPDLSWAKEIHGYVLRHGFDSDIFVVNALITLYGKSGETNLGRKLFDRTTGRDVVSWNSMISGYSQSGSYEECLKLYRVMVGAANLRPNAVTMMSVLQACTQLKDLVSGIEVHKFIIENDMEVDVFIYNSIIGLYAKCGSLDYARELFDEMKERDEISYGSMISGYMIHGFVEKAMELFRVMENPALSTWNAVISGLVQNNHHEGITKLLQEMQVKGCKPNAVTLSSVLPSFSYYSSAKGGKQIHCYAIRNNYNKNIYVATALIDIYAKTGMLRLAYEIFRQCKSKSVIVWTAIISAYAAHGDAHMAISLFTEMLTCGTKPDPVTFTAVLCACAHSGVVDEAQRIFNSMFPEFGIDPSVEHYACMVGALSRAGRIYEAADFIFKMPMEPTAKVWGALLNGVSVCGDVELGKFVFDQLLEIEPENTGNFIIMANLYSRLGRWKEAEMIREKMKNMGLKKNAGCSWIDTIDGVQSFIAGDVSKERTEEIYHVLKVLIEMMREEGYVSAVEFDEEGVYN